MKKTLATVILLTSLSVHADDTPFSPSLRGVHVVPMAKLGLTSDMKQSIVEGQQQEAQRGYVLTSEDNAGYLLNIKNQARHEFRQKNNYGVYDTQLKKSFRDIKLAIPYQGVKSIPKDQMIGYAAIGSFIKDKGWDGIRAFFTTDLGICSYSHMSVIAVELPQETTEYLVHKKPGNKIIEGNVNTGFVYTINWYTNTSMRTLECANINYDKDMMSKMIVLANKID